MYTITKLNHEILSATRELWSGQIAQNEDKIYPMHYHMVLKWAEDILNRNDNQVFVYAMHEKDHYGAVALMEISHAAPSSDHSWLKILDIHFQPVMDLELSPDKNMLAKIFSHALIYALELTFDAHPSNKLKFYGRNAQMTEFFSGVSTSLFPTLQLKIHQHGNWLVIEK